MTGYGKAMRKLKGKNLHVELKSLNSRQADITVKTPYVFREKELEIRNFLSDKLERGKIDCVAYFEVLENEQVPVINPSVVKNYYHQLKQISHDLDLRTDDQLLSIIMQLPETLKTENVEPDEMEWRELMAGLDEACIIVNKYRRAEGEKLKEDLSARINAITSLLLKIDPLEKERKERIRERILKNFHEYAKGMEIDQNRFEQEILYYLERNDFSEEKTRLQNHCSYFLENMEAGHGVGKMLGFISQEIGREINTLGSKAYDSSIQKIVVQMKDELEKVKEQLANVL